MVLTGASAEQATQQLAKSDGFLRKALDAGTNE
jgi:N-acetylmuramic acid 6-phosphate (MurNAc-6-P) etherase